MSSFLQIDPAGEVRHCFAGQNSVVPVQVLSPDGEWSRGRSQLPLRDNRLVVGFRPKTQNASDAGTDRTLVSDPKRIGSMPAPTRFGRAAD